MSSQPICGNDFAIRGFDMIRVIDMELNCGFLGRVVWESGLDCKAMSKN